MAAVASSIAAMQANRPPAIMDFFKHAKENPDVIKGAWVLMLECDYVWTRPLQVSGAQAARPGMQERVA